MDTCDSLQSNQVVYINDTITTFDKNMNISLPFIIRSSKDFINNIPNVSYLLKYFLNEKETIYSHGKSYGSEYNEHYIESKDLYESFLNGTLQYNVVDSPNENYELIPNELLQTFALDKDKLENMECAISYVLTNMNTLTKFHIDQYDGWMYLVEGKKLWWMISGDDMDYLELNSYPLDKIMHMEFKELITILDNYLVSKLHVGLCNSNDFIYIPFGWAHRVYTFVSSIGVSGTTNETRLHKSFM